MLVSCLESDFSFMCLKMPKVSVIVPVYNVEKYIGRCIESIQKQTLTDWELILVDDCSPDNSIEIIQEYEKKDSRIIVKRHDVNHGPMIARRWGDAIASGEYITYCDGDDMLPDNALEILYNAAIETNADIVSGNMTYVSTKGTETIIKSALKYGNDKTSAFKSLLRGELRHNLCSKIFKASLLKDYTYNSLEHFTNGEDGYIFYLTVRHINKIVQIDTPVYCYMQNVNSSSQVRLSENAINNICYANKSIKNITGLYPGLKNDLNRRITNILCSLYIKGYDSDAKLDYYVNKYQLSEYITWLNVIRYCRCSNLLRFAIKFLKG